MTMIHSYFVYTEKAEDYLHPYIGHIAALLVILIVQFGPILATIYGMVYGLLYALYGENVASWHPLAFIGLTMVLRWYVKILIKHA